MRQFYGRLEECVLSAGKTHVHKIPRFGGGGYFWVFLGGECRFYFYGRADFSETVLREIGGCPKGVLLRVLKWASTTKGALHKALSCHEAPQFHRASPGALPRHFWRIPRLASLCLADRIVSQATLSI